MAHIITGRPDETEIGPCQEYIPQLYSRAGLQREHMTFKNLMNREATSTSVTSSPMQLLALAALENCVIYPLLSFYQTQFRCRVSWDYI